VLIPSPGEVIELNCPLMMLFEGNEAGPYWGWFCTPILRSTPHVFVGYNFLLDGSGSNNERTRIRIVRYYLRRRKTLSEPLILLQDDIQWSWWIHDGCRLWITDDDKAACNIRRCRVTRPIRRKCSTTLTANCSE
jgi:hypothetical protein